MPRGTAVPTGCWDAHPRTPSVSRTDRTPPENMLKMNGLFPGGAQAPCDFSFSVSKFSPFFHSVSVMAAILRASVSRTMVGLLPLLASAGDPGDE